ncbi:hypothetical protein [uncultured Thomasclavelia sp.]|uniref:hypothetical protein n=1 Tax=uncultured Thomasclavelia sp. TaxID=3025759 RepID=UPI0025DCC1A9|nr:hypothetical protein [uncultured Thomasclavelia sp.]
MTEKEKEQEYKRLCIKLGFIPSEYEPDTSKGVFEDGNMYNPFKKLTYDELMFLYDNGYLDKK